MKIELIKKIEKNSCYYYTNVDGRYINGSISDDINQAENIYNQIVENKGLFPTEEVLKSVEI